MRILLRLSLEIENEDDLAFGRDAHESRLQDLELVERHGVNDVGLVRSNTGHERGFFKRAERQCLVLRSQIRQ